MKLAEMGNRQFLGTSGLMKLAACFRDRARFIDQIVVVERLLQFFFSKRNRFVQLFVLLYRRIIILGRFKKSRLWKKWNGILIVEIGKRGED